MSRFLFRLAVGAAILFLTVPILIIVPMSLTSSRFLSFPPKGLSLRWYHRFLASQEWTDAILESLQIGLLAALLATVFGVMAALALNERFKGDNVIRAFIMSPMLMPAIVLAIAYYIHFTRFNQFGITLLDRLPGVVIAHTTITMPFVMITVSAALKMLDRNLIYAARNLGATDFEVFRYITFPVIRPGVLTGALFAFLTSFDELVITLFLSGAQVRTLPVKMWDGIRFEIEPTLAAVATLLISVSICILFAAELIGNRATQRLQPANEAIS